MRVLEQTSATVISCLSLLGIWFVLVGSYRWYRIDLFRQRLFSLRDELFDLALERRVAFDDPAYAQLRTTINGYIRFAERFGILHLTLAQMFVPDGVFSQSSFVGSGPRWTANTRALSEEVRISLNSIMQRVHREVAEHMLATSPFITLFTLVVFVPVVLVRLILNVSRRVAQGPVEASRRLVRDFLDSADTTAFIAGAT